MDLQALRAINDQPTLDLLRRLNAAASPDSRAEHEVVALTIELLSSDPSRSFAAIRRLNADYLPWLERRSVFRARQLGRGWARIARALGRSRQAIHKQYSGDADLGSVLPPRPLARYGERQRAELHETRADLKRQRAADAAAEDNSLVPW